MPHRPSEGAPSGNLPRKVFQTHCSTPITRGSLSKSRPGSCGSQHRPGLSRNPPSRPLWASHSQHRTGASPPPLTAEGEGGWKRVSFQWSLISVFLFPQHKRCSLSIPPLSFPLSFPHPSRPFFRKLQAHKVGIITIPTRFMTHSPVCSLSGLFV